MFNVYSRMPCWYKIGKEKAMYKYEIIYKTHYYVKESTDSMLNIWLFLLLFCDAVDRAQGLIHASKCSPIELV